MIYARLVTVVLRTFFVHYRRIIGEQLWTQYARTVGRRERVSGVNGISCVLLNIPRRGILYFTVKTRKYQNAYCRIDPNPGATAHVLHRPWQCKSQTHHRNCIGAHHSRHACFGSSLVWIDCGVHSPLPPSVVDRETLCGSEGARRRQRGPFEKVFGFHAWREILLFLGKTVIRRRVTRFKNARDLFARVAVTTCRVHTAAVAYRGGSVVTLIALSVAWRRRKKN